MLNRIIHRLNISELISWLRRYPHAVQADVDVIIERRKFPICVVMTMDRYRQLTNMEDMYKAAKITIEKTPI